MYRGTTPTLPISIIGADLTEAKLYLTIRGPKGEELTFHAPGDFTVEKDGEDTVGELKLTQEQTMMLSAGSCRAQIRWVTADGAAGATEETILSVRDVILKGVIRYDE